METHCNTPKYTANLHKLNNDLISFVDLMERERKKGGGRGI